MTDFAQLCKEKFRCRQLFMRPRLVRGSECIQNHHGTRHRTVTVVLLRKIVGHHRPKIGCRILREKLMIRIHADRPRSIFGRSAFFSTNGDESALIVALVQQLPAKEAEDDGAKRFEHREGRTKDDRANSIGWKYGIPARPWDATKRVVSDDGSLSTKCVAHAQAWSFPVSRLRRRGK